MRGLDALQALISPPPGDPVGELLDVAKTFVHKPVQMDTVMDTVEKRRTPGIEHLPIDDLQSDPYHQRPVDWTKIAAMRETLRSGGTLPPIKVNQRENGELYITNGQHRAAAHALEGHDGIDAVLTHRPAEDEHEEYDLIAKAAAGGRIPAGDPRRGRIHPGEWTKENNPATLKKAAEEAESLPERAVIHHRLSQLRGKHGVAGLLSDKQLAETQEQLAAARAKSTPTGAAKAIRADEEWMRQLRYDAAGKTLGYNWQQALVNATLEKRADYRAAARKMRRLHDKLNQARGAISDHPDGKRQDRARERALKVRQTYHDAVNEHRDLRIRLTGTPYGSHHDPEIAQRELGINFDRHLQRNKSKIETELKRQVAGAASDLSAASREQAKEHQATLKAHGHAKKIATAKARESRKLQPAFEKQSLAGRWLGDLRKHPGHQRAMFLDGSYLRDGVAYSEYTRPLKPAKAHVVTLNRGELGPELQAQGLFGTPAWGAALNGAGEAIHLTGRRPTRADIDRHLKKHSPDLKPRERTRAARAYLAAAKTAPVREIQDWHRARSFEFRTTAEVPVEHEDQLVDAMLGLGAKVTDNEVNIREYRSWADAEMDAGKRFTIDLGRGRKVHYVPHYTVGTRTVNKYTHKITLGPVSAQKRTALLKKIDAKLAGLTGTYDSLIRDDWERLRNVVEQLPKKPIEFTVESEKFDRPDLPADQLKAVSRRLSPDAKRLLAYGGYSGDAAQGPRPFLLREVMAHTRTKGEGRQAVPHRAPFSERGMLHLDNMPPADALRLLKRLGAAKGLTPEVPYNLIYRSGRRNGRVIPHHPDFATGEHSLTVPEGVGVFHGLTSKHANATDQLKRLIRDGGIKSIAERRRLGRRTGGLSEKGDMGSGIDQYVFTNIAHGPSYGHGGLVFSVKPSALKRRDIAFAPRDFGGGSNRHERYNAHAKRLGQKAFYDPPTAEGRQRNLDKHLGKHNAEVLFKHEIPWEDIDTLYVAEPHHHEVAKLIRAAQRQGRVPKGLRVVKGQDNAEIQRRLGELSPDDE